MSMRGRRMVVTGGASGIGREAVIAFLRLGAKVAVLDLAPPQQALSDGRRMAFFERVDVSDEGGVTAAIDDAARVMGGIDGVVNAAGVVSLAPLQSTTLENWERMLRINLTGTFLVCRAAAGHLIEQAGATIVNVASGQALLPNANSTAYAASKGGVVSLTKALAVDLAPRVRANSICPGHVATPMTQDIMATAETESTLRKYALRRVADPAEIAAAIVFLSSAASSIITGACLSADGGRTFH